MAEKEKLMDDYHRLLHEVAVARNPIEAETALRIIENIITMLSVKIPEREAKEMKQTASCFYRKTMHRIEDGI